MPEILDGAVQTISVKTRSKWGLRRLKVEYPTRAVSGSKYPPYDATSARALLSRTDEIPSSKRGLLAVLTEYRHALSALAVEPADSDAG